MDLDFINDIIIDNIAKGYIESSEIHGFGLFAKDYIAKGDILCILDGQIMSWSKYNEIEKKSISHIKESFAEYIFMEWNALDEETLLVRPFRTKYSYINHSRKPNIVIKKFPLRIIALENIDKDVELTLDYRREPLNSEYIKNHGYSYL